MVEQGHRTPHLAAVLLPTLRDGQPAIGSLPISSFNASNGPFDQLPARPAVSRSEIAQPELTAQGRFAYSGVCSGSDVHRLGQESRDQRLVFAGQLLAVASHLLSPVSMSVPSGPTLILSRLALPTARYDPATTTARRSSVSVSWVC
jgi:hypothetical protein